MDLFMKLTPEEELTLKSYDKISSDWVAKHKTPHFWFQEMLRFNKYLPRGRVLEIGAGGGRDAKELIAMGYRYVGTDISSNLLAEARVENPGVEFYNQSVYDLDYPENYFDGFWTSATLLHIPKSRIAEALGKIHYVVKAKGIGFISIKQGKGEKIETEEAHLLGRVDRFFAYYSQEEFAEVLKKNEFDILEMDVRSVSEKTIWLIYFVAVLK